MKILIIDDSDEIRLTLQDILELNGHEVVAADCGEDGVKLLAATKPEFIFCDVSMPPGMDGFAVIEAVRQQPEGKLVPFVFLTGNTDRVDQRRGMALGADDYISKPFSEKDVLEAIAARTHRQKPLNERIDELTEQRRREVGADWSHELLTPLNGMLGGLQLLEMEMETISPEELKDIVGMIRDGVQRQEKLSRKLLRYFELERIQQGLLPPGNYRCPAGAGLTAGTQRALEGSSRAADVHVHAEDATVPLRDAFLADAITELVDNALRFSQPGQRVTVNGRRNGTHYTIEVTDEGTGMTAADRSAVGAFTQFGRKQREQQGLGLGLAIVRAIARLAQGQLILDDAPGGRGLKATLQLPVA